MASVVFDAVSKHFGPVRAVDQVSLSIRTGEFVALLGPSGCGKTTLLRLLAGFEAVEGGRLTVGDRVLSDAAVHIPAEERNIGMVFQSYALWPHMSVRENVEFSLKIKHLPREERSRRVEAALEAVGLEALALRRPEALSGGQRQRVALARCLAMAPSVVLLDEPLANLDAHLRKTMQDEFRAFHRRTGSTMIYVTHDQAEALALADRIAVMMRGRLCQFATPYDLYRTPATADVARFIGQGMIVPATVDRVDPVAERGGESEVSPVTTCRVDIAGIPARVRCLTSTVPGRGEVCLRAESLRLVSPEESRFSAVVETVVFQGATTALDVRSPRLPQTLFHLFVDPAKAPRCGETVYLAIDDGWLLPNG